MGKNEMTEWIEKIIINLIQFLGQFLTAIHVDLLATVRDGDNLEFGLCLHAWFFFHCKWEASEAFLNDYKERKIKNTDKLLALIGRQYNSIKPLYLPEADSDLKFPWEDTIWLLQVDKILQKR